MKRKEITKEEIVELYINQNLPASKVRKILGICNKVMFDYLKEYQIEKTSEQKYNCRSKWTHKYNDDELQEKVQDLYINQQLSYKEVREKLKISGGKLSKMVKKLGYKRPMSIILTNMKKTCIDKYGVETNCELDHVRSQQHKSKEEDEAYQLLIKKFNYTDIIRQYKTTEYPFPCDFYIKPLDMYIEFNPGPRHNGRPFNPLNEEDQKELEYFKKKAKIVSDWYEGVIRTWTKRDPLKRKIAKDNNLNWKEFFTLKELKEWLDIQK